MLKYIFLKPQIFIFLKKRRNSKYIRILAICNIQFFLYIFVKTQTTQLNQVSQLKKKQTVHMPIPEFTWSLKQFESFQLKFNVWNKSAHYSQKKNTSPYAPKKQGSETETYNRSHAPLPILFLIFKQMPCSFHIAGKNTY